MILSNQRYSKYEQPFTLKILDADFNLVTLISYDNLQWDRLYNTVGKFVVQGVTGAQEGYSRSRWKYVYTEKRKELGVISQINFKKDEDRKILTLSGLFLECEVNKMVCYSKPTAFADSAGTNYGTSILSAGSPQWVTAEGTADAVARAFYDGFKQISFRNYLVGDFGGTRLVDKTYALNIVWGSIAAGTYNYSIHNRNNEYLGNKLYDILKESYGSYEVVLDYETKVKTINIIHGVIRTQTGHAQGVNPVLLSTKNGSVKRANIVESNTKTKDATIQYITDDEKTLILANALPDSVGRFESFAMASNQSDFIKEDTPDKAAADRLHKLSVMGDASTRLHALEDVVNIQFDFVNSSYKYMEDFDLGDVISIDIPEIDVSMDAQIVACHEVVKAGVWSMSIEVGKQIIRKRGNE